MNILIKKLLLGTIMGLVAFGCSFFGKGSEEQPTYRIILKEDNKEIRRYDSYLTANTTISGTFEDAQSKGFRILAGYIFGKNNTQQKISMTAPVLQKVESKKISMTAPVLIAPNENKSWTMSFSMPSQFTMETLPEPTDNRIKIEKVDIRLFAAITYSGFWDESRNAQEALKLLKWMEGHDEYEIISQAMFAGYNPPWTLPFLRRNEMLVELKRK